jgi:hypothetical protein
VDRSTWIERRDYALLDENSDFVANDAEQKVIREPPQIRSPDITLPD